MSEIKKFSLPFEGINSLSALKEYLSGKDPSVLAPSEARVAELLELYSNDQAKRYREVTYEIDVEAIFNREDYLLASIYSENACLDHRPNREHNCGGILHEVCGHCSKTCDREHEAELKKRRGSNE
ncbi:MAG: hypothetical protein EP319_08480 [Deltaproteobacteria bacterium]|nr:MAG: hypothetical protein EP319_08480 [Deltaproteobacteria bacterium]